MNYKCPKCGEEINETVSACPKCGVPFNWKTPAPVPKQKKKKKHRFLKFLMWLFLIAAALALLWFAVGNMITLHFHSEKVVSAINGGSLDLPGLKSNTSEMPNYVKQMLGKSDENDNGPVVEAVLPYLHVQRDKIHGFFGASEVDYIIYAPDLESWLLDMDTSTIYSSEQLLSELLAYIPNAPLKARRVSIKYYSEGLFDWRGNYKTPEFADAISGGINSAYNVYYEKMLQEIKEALQ